MAAELKTQKADPLATDVREKMTKYWAQHSEQGSVQEMMEALGSLWYITAGWHIMKTPRQKHRKMIAAKCLYTAGWNNKKIPSDKTKRQ